MQIPELRRVFGEGAARENRGGIADEDDLGTSSGERAVGLGKRRSTNQTANPRYTTVESLEAKIARAKVALL